MEILDEWHPLQGGISVVIIYAFHNLVLWEKQHTQEDEETWKLYPLKLIGDRRKKNN